MWRMTFFCVWLGFAHWLRGLGALNLFGFLTSYPDVLCTFDVFKNSADWLFGGQWLECSLVLMGCCLMFLDSSAGCCVFVVTVYLM